MQISQQSSHFRRLLHQEHLVAPVGQSQGRGHAAYAAADDQSLGIHL